MGKSAQTEALASNIEAANPPRAFEAPLASCSDGCIARIHRIFSNPSLPAQDLLRSLVYGALAVAGGGRVINHMKDEPCSSSLHSNRSL
jgi:hypothetical protein